MIKDNATIHDVYDWLLKARFEDCQDVSNSHSIISSCISVDAPDAKYWYGHGGSLLNNIDWCLEFAVKMLGSDIEYTLAMRRTGHTCGMRMLPVSHEAFSSSRDTACLAILVAVFGLLTGNCVMIHKDGILR